MSKHFIKTFHAECILSPHGDYGLKSNYEKGTIYECKLIKIKKFNGKDIGNYIFIRKLSGRTKGEEIGVSTFNKYFLETKYEKNFC